MRNDSKDTAAQSPRLSQLGAVLTAVKGKSLRDGLRPPLTAAPRRALTEIGSGRGDAAGRSNKEMPWQKQT
jgi:hypothetical protein